MFARAFKTRVRDWTAIQKVGLGCTAYFVAFILLFFILMKVFWGYWLIRPSVHQDVRNMSSLDGIGYFDRREYEGNDDSSEDSFLKRLSQIPPTAERGSDYYDLSIQPMQAARRAGFNPAEAPVLQREQVDRVIAWFRASGVSAAARSDEGVWGLVMSFRAGDGEQLYLFSAVGDQVANDHYPYYEVLFDRNGQVFHSQTIFIEWAGTEGLEFPLTIFASLIYLVVLTCAGGIIYGLYRAGLSIREAFR